MTSLLFARYTTREGEPVTDHICAEDIHRVVNWGEVMADVTAERDRLRAALVEIRDEIADACSMWASTWDDQPYPEAFTAQEVRDEVNPVIDRVTFVAQAALDGRDWDEADTNA